MKKSIHECRVIFGCRVLSQPYRLYLSFFIWISLCVSRLRPLSHQALRHKCFSPRQNQASGSFAFNWIPLAYDSCDSSVMRVSGWKQRNVHLDFRCVHFPLLLRCTYSWHMTSSCTYTTSYGDGCRAALNVTIGVLRADFLSLTAFTWLASFCESLGFSECIGALLSLLFRFVVLVWIRSGSLLHFSPHEQSQRRGGA